LLDPPGPGRECQKGTGLSQHGASPSGDFGGEQQEEVIVWIRRG